MATPNAAYNANNIPFGGLFINLYRFVDGSGEFDQTAVPATIASNAVLESFTPAIAAVGGTRPAVDGGDGGWWVVNGVIEGSGTVQIATSSSITPQNGDIFLCSSIFNDINGTAVPYYFVLMNCAITVSTTEYRKFSCTIRVDRTAASTLTNVASIIEATN